MGLDVRALWLIGALTSSSCGLLVLVLHRQYPAPSKKALTLFGAANIILGANYLLSLGHAWVGEFAFHVIGNVCVSLSLGLEYAAVCTLKRTKVRYAFVLGPSILVLLLDSSLTFLAHNFTIQDPINDSINASVMIVLAWSFYEKEEDRRPYPDLIAAVVYGILTAVNVVSIAQAVRTGQFPAENDYNVPESIVTNIAAIIVQTITLSLFMLMLSERLNRTMTEQAMRDPLTQLYNRRAFEELAFREISGAARSKAALSFLIFDLDKFKSINDQYGHTAGDEILRSSAILLREGLRDEDFLARWGGDEFCAILPRTGPAQAEAVAVRILSAFSHHTFPCAHKKISVTLCVGISLLENGERDLHALFARADAALYRAKTSGRNTFEFAPQLRWEPPENSLGTSLAHLPSHDLPSSTA